MTGFLSRLRGSALAPDPARRARAAWRLGAALVAAVCLAASAEAQDPCLECHGLLGLGLHGRSLWVQRGLFENGVHGRLFCSDCHKGFDDFPHVAQRESRCDLPCHVAGASHEPIARAETGRPHSRAAGGCSACHDGGSALRGHEADARCRGCHGSVDVPEVVFPSGQGSFGRRAHATSADVDRVPGCVACHGAHGIDAGEKARQSCAQSECHPGGGAKFARLFSHGQPQTPRPWGGAGLVGMSLGGLVGAFLLLHAVRTKP